MPKYKLKRDSYRKAQQITKSTIECIDSIENFVPKKTNRNNSDNDSVDLNLSENNCVTIISSLCSNHNSETCLFSFEESEEETTTCVSDSITFKLNEDTESFPQFLAKWATKYQISHVALNPLLLSINNHFSANLPIDPRTLLNTPRELNIRIVEPGSSLH